MKDIILFNFFLIETIKKHQVIKRFQLKAINILFKIEVIT